VTVLSPHGRWGGAATQRPLPLVDDEIAQMPKAQRERIARLWWCQAATEERVAHSFKVVHKALVFVEADAGIVATAHRAIDDEYRHAALCMQVASHYLGHTPQVPKPLAFAHPTHPEARTERVRRALYIVGQCVFNETFASAYLAASLECATHPVARAALRELLSDEIDHARIGWAYLSSMPGDLRAELTEWLLPLAIGNLRVWRALSLPTELASAEGHGIPKHMQVEEALVSVLRTLIVPGLSHAGLSSNKLAQWAEDGAETS
jgi:hypothetical protein